MEQEVIPKHLLLCFQKKPPEMLHPEQEGHGPVGASPEEGHQVDQRDAELLL